MTLSDTSLCDLQIHSNFNTQECSNTNRLKYLSNLIQPHPLCRFLTLCATWRGKAFLLQAADPLMCRWCFLTAMGNCTPWWVLKYARFRNRTHGCQSMRRRCWVGWDSGPFAILPWYWWESRVRGSPLRRGWEHLEIASLRLRLVPWSCRCLWNHTWVEYRRHRWSVWWRVWVRWGLYWWWFVIESDALRNGGLI